MHRGAGRRSRFGPAGNSSCPVPRQPGADGRRCSHREQAPISRQEHEAWEVLLACQGQLRLAPSGHVIGIGMDAALKIGAARGADLVVLSELLPAAEAGMVEALCSDRVLDDRP